MKLAIYTIEKTLFEGDIEKIVTKTKTGEITILDNHVPLVTALVRGELRIKTRTQEEKLLNLKSGFLEVRPENEAVILAEV